jgi:ParB family transcriptional regulator, chromosome partitioning protein
MATKTQQLKYLSPNEIEPNPENPRLVFRQDEMESLMRSIDTHGIQVPLSVYRDDTGFRLIDGERRWRCARKLNLKSVPVLIQERPSELENLVLMYNIHALREQWDYYTIASKLRRVIDLFKVDNGSFPNEIQLSELTGLTRGAIRRCQLLLGMPDRFQNMMLLELEKPKPKQRLTEDFFIEMEKSLRSVTRRIPAYAPRLDAIRDTLVTKFSAGVISAVTDFRQLSKIATAVDSLGVAERNAKRVLDKLFDDRDKTSIRDAYASTVEFEYDEKKAARHITSLASFVQDILEEDRSAALDPDFVAQLRNLHKQLALLLREV